MSETPQVELPLDEISLFVDADGTLLDISLRPEYAQASRALLTVLHDLYYALGGALAIVSGRRIEDIDRLFAPLRLPASGIHGAQMRIAADGDIIDGGAPDISAHFASLVTAVAARHPGAFVEDKGKALAVHWRAAPRAEQPLRTELAEIVESFAPQLAILSGHCVYEIKSAGATKGDAVRAFMALPPFAGRSPIFVGDDITDIAGIAAAKALGGRAFSVGQTLEGADAVFASPQDVRAWLGRLVGTSPEAKRA